MLDKNYLCFETLEDGYISWKIEDVIPAQLPALRYSLDEGDSWIRYTIGDDIEMTSNQKCYWRSTTNFFSYYDGGDYYIHFVSDVNVKASGEVDSLINWSALTPYCYKYMFSDCTNLITAPELPATTLSNECYCEMFYGCTSLLKTPEILPAMELEEQCYNGMFNGCVSIIESPILPATTLSPGCYYEMFYDCESLKKTPDLPALELEEGCYASMFYNCTDLNEVSALPATTLSLGCYYEMFYGCTSLVYPPELPATELAINCYARMFNGCSSLIRLPSLPATNLADSCYSEMFSGCSLIMLSEEEDNIYTIPYRIPTEGSGIVGQDSLYDMFYDTGGTFTGTPDIDTTYYLKYIKPPRKDGLILSVRNTKSIGLHNIEPKASLDVDSLTDLYFPRIRVGNVDLTITETEATILLNILDGKHPYDGLNYGTEDGYTLLTENGDYLIAE